MAYYGRANCYEMLNQPDKALQDYAHSYAINKNFEEALTAYRLLKSKTH
jgi:tetratricopeptide (TPR) repeat protein